MIASRTYVRWQAAASRRVREFGVPLAPDHPAFLATCAFCTYRLGDDVGGPAGVALVALGPDDDDSWEAHAAGRWYSALAMVVHAKCLRELSDDALEQAAEVLAPEAAALAAEASDGTG